MEMSTEERMSALRRAYCYKYSKWQRFNSHHVICHIYHLLKCYCDGHKNSIHLLGKLWREVQHQLLKQYILRIKIWEILSPMFYPQGISLDQQEESRQSFVPTCITEKFTFDLENHLQVGVQNSMLDTCSSLSLP